MFRAKRYELICVVVALQVLAGGRDPFQFYQQGTPVEPSTVCPEHTIETSEVTSPALPLNQWNVIASSAQRIVLKSPQGDVRIVELHP